ncbi:hypothetical protein PROH_03375 [Prochlorothrix hollandica PCC 9006 = CALU 1027]|uniref:Uncharacterized protein n=1 Tax=Prochlorothrix hollandica PCC 9006 = CALU 1027 TaxID=317619 RepID=A0A0M2PZ21_PROHO|nr:hypothetical protein PROH_03375 [Prochlorothrix hollandica PCC 9006 = CALU 1027]
MFQCQRGNQGCRGRQRNFTPVIKAPNLGRETNEWILCPVFQGVNFQGVNRSLRSHDPTHP